MPLQHLIQKSHIASSSISHITFSPAADQLIVGTLDGTVSRWPVPSCESEEAIVREGPNKAVLDVAFAAGERVVAYADGFVECRNNLWNLWPRIEITSLAFGPDGRFVVAGGAAGYVGLARLDLSQKQMGKKECAWKLVTKLDTIQTGPEQGSTWKGHWDRISNIAFSPDGTKVATAGEDRTVRVWDTGTGDSIGLPWQSHSRIVESVAFSPVHQDHRLVTGSRDGTIRLWDTRTGAPVGDPWFAHPGGVTAVDFHPKDHQVISAGRDGTLRLWDSKTGAQKGKPWSGGHMREVAILDAAFAPNGEHVISAGADGKLILWDAKQGQPLFDPWIGDESGIESVAFSPNGDRIVSGGSSGSLSLWNAVTRERIGEPWTTPSAQAMLSVAFSSDGKRVISGSKDGRLWLWDVDGGKPLLPSWQAHDGAVRDVAFSPDEHDSASCGDDGMVKIWDAQTGAPIGTPF